MRKAGRITADTIDRRARGGRAPASPPPTSTGSPRTYIRVAGRDRRRSRAIGAGPFPFPRSICTSLNDEVVHGIPSRDRVLREGDLLSLDFGAIWEGFHARLGGDRVRGRTRRRPRPRSSSGSPRSRSRPAIAMIRRAGACPTSATPFSRSSRAPGLGVVREYVGHGIGRALHEDPPDPELRPARRGPGSAPGLVVAIEPMVNIGGWQTRVLARRLDRGRPPTGRSRPTSSTRSP